MTMHTIFHGLKVLSYPNMFMDVITLIWPWKGGVQFSVSIFSKRPVSSVHFSRTMSNFILAVSMSDLHTCQCRHFDANVGCRFFKNASVACTAAVQNSLSDRTIYST